MGGVAISAHIAPMTKHLVRDKRNLSRQRILCRDRLYNVFCCDGEISITIDFSRTSVATEFSLSRQSLHGPMSRQSFMCRNRA